MDLLESALTANTEGASHHRERERYRAVAAGVVRTGAALDSPKGDPVHLELGQEFDVLARETLTHSGAKGVGEVDLVRLKFACPSGHGDVWTSEKGKTGKVLVELVGTKAVAPLIKVTFDGTKKAKKKHGEIQYSFSVSIGDECVHTILGTHTELHNAFARVPNLVCNGGFDGYGMPTFPSKGLLFDDSPASIKQHGKYMRDFFAAILEDNACRQGKKIDKVHHALKIDPETSEADLPGPVSQRLIDAAAYHHGQIEAARIAKKNAEAAVKIQAAYRGKTVRDTLLETKAKVIEGVRSTVEPTLIGYGYTWQQAVDVIQYCNGGVKLLRAITNLETLPIKLGIAIVMEGLRPQLEPIFAEKGVSWEQAVTMVVRAGTLPVGGFGDVKGIEDVNHLAQDPEQFAHSLLAASGSASKRFLPECFSKQIDAYLVHEDYQELYTQGDPTESFEGKLYDDGFTQNDAMMTSTKRPGRGETLLDHVPALCLFKNIEPDDLRQGALGNVWLVAAIAAVAEMPEKLKRLFTQKTLAPDGRYDVQLFHPVTEEWVTVSVDDRLAVNLKGEVEFMQLTSDVELWPCILEKAMAKLFGSYRALDATVDDRGFPGLSHTVSPALALEMLTGSTGTNLLMIVYEDDAWHCYSSLGDPIEWPDDLSSGPRDTVGLVNLLEQLDKQECIMIADDHAKNGTYFDRACKNRDEGLPETFGFINNATGLIDCHAYSLIEVRQDIEGLDECDLVKMRNPWANTEWKGDWGDTSKKWAEYPKVKERVGFKAGNDGVFWMSTQDFVKEFQAIHICLSDKAQAVMLQKQKEIKKASKEASTDAGEAAEEGEGGAASPHVGSGTSAPSVAHIASMSWVLHHGELEKKKGITSGRHKCFCCLEVECLKYYTHEGHGGELMGIIELQATNKARACTAPNATDAEFELETAGRTYRFFAQSRDDRDVWLRKLHESIVAVGATKLKRSLAIEEGGHGGGKFGRWKDYHFAVREEVTKRSFFAIYM
jgi:hypothetical protein